MSRICISLLAGSAVLFSALPVFAQDSRPERPNRGLFGGGTDQFEQVLSANGTVGSGYDTDPQAGVVDVGLAPFALPGPVDGSFYNQFSGGLSYSATFPKLAAEASLSSSGRLFPQSDLSMINGHAASGGVSLTGVSIGKTSFNGHAFASYQSMRSFMPFPGSVDAVLGEGLIATQDYGQDYRGGSADYRSYTASASVTRQLSRRSSLTAGYDGQNSTFGSGSNRVNQQTGFVRFGRNLSRYLNLRLGYGLTQAKYESTNREYLYHSLDTGVDYSRELSLTRRTKLSFTSGAAAIRYDQVTRFDVVGSATLNREIARTWHAMVSYNRSVGFIESINEPVFSDGLSASFGGLISPRVSFHSGAGASVGNVGVTSSNSRNGFDAWTGFSGLSAALTRHLAVGINYTYYRYAFEQDASIAAGLPPRVNRHSVFVSLNAWAPLFQHGKRP